MNKREKAVAKYLLNREQQQLDDLKLMYEKALEDIKTKIEFHLENETIILQYWDSLDDETKSRLSAEIYQRQFQEGLYAQLTDMLADMQMNQYSSIMSYLEHGYESNYIGTIYAMHGEDIPVIIPIRKSALVQAITLDSKISEGLYNRLGINLEYMKRQIAQHITRGIATSESYTTIARNITLSTGAGMNRSMRIARTEGHRVQMTGAFNAMKEATARGARVVKQWDATLDQRTRESHRMMDGELRELDEPFSNGLMYPSEPNGAPSEVINCRCALLQRATWALDEEELEILKRRAAFYGLDKEKQFEDFKKKYLTINSGD